MPRNKGITTRLGRALSLETKPPPIQINAPKQGDYDPLQPTTRAWVRLTTFKSMPRNMGITTRLRAARRLCSSSNSNQCPETRGLRHGPASKELSGSNYGHIQINAPKQGDYDAESKLNKFAKGLRNVGFKSMPRNKGITTPCMFSPLPPCPPVAFKSMPRNKGITTPRLFLLHAHSRPSIQINAPKQGDYD